MRLEEIPFVPSPNFSSRRTDRVCHTVIHYTAGPSASSSVRWLVDPRARASAHVVISRSGRITQLVELDFKAWHAGVSEIMVDGEMKSDANRYTLGVELANHGYLHRENGDYYYTIGRHQRRYKGVPPQHAALVFDDGHVVEGYWEPYADAQITALQNFLRSLLGTPYAEAARSCVGHEEVGMPLGRKIDPGPLFPWHRLPRLLDRRTHRREASNGA